MINAKYTPATAGCLPTFHSSALLPSSHLLDHASPFGQGSSPLERGIPWRMMPNVLPPWHTAYQQTQRWLKAGVFEAMVRDLRALLRLAEGRKEQPRAAIGV